VLKEHDLQSPGANRPRKRVGRGGGSGYGKTAGRGTKGQKARAGGAVSRYFQGGQNPIHKQLPYKRGFTNNFRVEYNVVNLGQLEEKFEAGAEVTVEVIRASKLARKRYLGVKILGVGELTKALTIEAHKVSKSAREKIEAAGGRVILLTAEGGEGGEAGEAGEAAEDEATGEPDAEA
jgi:large subunit ribosomal protein L15